ncbi:MAG: DNA-directed RNA polymerase subunit alpha [Candidatus Sumerlaeia bacterium]|nr:DNA-directed RNA polymerase subunit alpha [Candidatus Sumerlaeia bacterium]
MELQAKPFNLSPIIVPDVTTLSDSFGRFHVEPLQRGYGTTLGNSLRRVLLSSIPGAAATSVRFEGVRHEFASIPGGREDVNDVILNLKQVVFRMLTKEKHTTLELEKTGPCVVKAGDFADNDDVEILNPEHPLLTLSAGETIQMDVMVTQSEGYILAVYPEMEDEDDIGILPIDAVFSPIRKVRYEVSEARIGQRTDYDKLTLEITTNGAIRPEEALSYAAKLLRDHLDLFIRMEDRKATTSDVVEGSVEAADEKTTTMMSILDKSIEELELSVRSFNCLEAAGIKTIRDLVQKSESEMLKYRNFGRKSLSEIKAILKSFSLSFNMKLDERGLPVNLNDE